MAAVVKRVVAAVIGVFYFALAGLAYRTSADGWSAGHSDVGFWWAVIGTLLGIAGVSAIIGTWLHTRSAES